MNEERQKEFCRRLKALLFEYDARLEGEGYEESGIRVVVKGSCVNWSEIDKIDCHTDIMGE